MYRKNLDSESKERKNKMNNIVTLAMETVKDRLSGGAEEDATGGGSGVEDDATGSEEAAATGGEQ